MWKLINTIIELTPIHFVESVLSRIGDYASDDYRSCLIDMRVQSWTFSQKSMVAKNSKNAIVINPATNQLLTIEEKYDIIV